jgi:glycosyltransferase involved in cell wall biosynthesis
VRLPEDSGGLRLLLFAHTPHLGGSEQVLLQLVRELIRDHGVGCTVVAPEEGPLPAHLREAGAEVWIWTLPWWCTVADTAPEAARRLLADGASELLEGFPAAAALDPDAVLSITTVTPWGGLVAALLGKPHVWYVTDFGPDSPDRLRYFLDFEEVRKAVLTGSDQVVVVSEAVRDRVFPDADPPPKAVFPHLEVSPSAGGRPEPPAGARVRLRVFGNVRRSKGHWDAVDALAALTRRGVDVELEVIGPTGPEGDELVRHAAELEVAERLRITGFVADQHEWMRGADVVLVPSHDETFSLVSLEALLHGKPLVATAVGGIVEFVRDRENGLLVPPRDPQAMARAVETLVRDPTLAARLAERGRRDARSRFTADAFGGRFRRLLGEVVGNGRRCGTPEALLTPLRALAEDRRRLADELARTRAALDDRTREEEARHRATEEALAEALAEELAQELARARHRLGKREDELAAERRRSRERDAELQALDDKLRRISETRAWRLINLYWRLARRLPRRS